MRRCKLEIVKRPPDPTENGGRDPPRIGVAGQSKQRLKSLDLVAALRNLDRGRKIAEQRSQISRIEANSSALDRQFGIDDTLPFDRGLRRQRDKLDRIAEPDHLDGERLVGGRTSEKFAKFDSGGSDREVCRRGRLA